MPDLSAVGSSASMKKSDRAKEYDGTGSFRKSDNGGFILSLGQRYKEATRKNENYPSTYCASEELVFDDKKSMMAAIEKHL